MNANDPRTAQQISGLAVILLAFLFMQVLSFILLSLPEAVVATVLLFLVGAASLWLAERLFQRETILTRWT